jgi:hypothetical protein
MFVFHAVTSEGAAAGNDITWDQVLLYDIYIYTLVHNSRYTDVICNTL